MPREDSRVCDSAVAAIATTGRPMPDIVVISKERSHKNGQLLSNRMISFLRKYEGNIIVVANCKPTDSLKLPPFNLRLICNYAKDTNSAHATLMALEALEASSSTHNDILVCEDSLTYYELLQLRTAIISGKADGPHVVVSRSEENRVGVNIIEGKASVFSYGLSVNWTGAVIMDKGLRKEFFKKAGRERCRSWFLWEVLNDLGPLDILWVGAKT